MATSYQLHLFAKNAGSATEVKRSCQEVTGCWPRKPGRWLTAWLQGLLCLVPDEHKMNMCLGGDLKLNSKFQTQRG